METGGILIVVGLLFLISMWRGGCPTCAGVVAPFILFPGIVVFLLGFFDVVPNSLKENIVLLVLGILVISSIRFWAKLIIKKLTGKDIVELD